MAMVPKRPGGYAVPSHDVGPFAENDAQTTRLRDAGREPDLVDARLALVIRRRWHVGAGKKVVRVSVVHAVVRGPSTSRLGRRLERRWAGRQPRHRRSAA
jgi:hypothetical protein